MPVNILLVEDNPGDVLLTQEAFKEGSYFPNLSVAEDGEEALQFLRKQGKYKDAPTPDLILLDLNLPKKDGRELLADIKQDPAFREIPVIILTTSDADQDIRRAYRLHANCYLTKPLEMDSFVSKIRSVENFWLDVARLPSRA